MHMTVTPIGKEEYDMTLEMQVKKLLGINAVQNIMAKFQYYYTVSDYAAIGKLFYESDTSSAEVPGGGMPPFMMGDAPKNLTLNLKNTKLDGIVSSAIQHYREGLKFLEETIREELSNVTQTPAPTVNNGVLVSLDEKSVWTVTGDSYITSLTLAEGAVVTAPSGKKLAVTVDGQPAQLAAGIVTGKIHIAVV